MRVYFTWAASHNPYLSFGKAGRYVAQEFTHLCDLTTDADVADLQVYLGIPLYVLRGQWRRRCTRYLWYTMWESPQVPQNQIDRINAVEGLASPCLWCDDVYKKRGVHVPRFIVPLGIDPEVYPKTRRPKRKSFTFLWVGGAAGHIRQIAEGRADRIGDRKRGWMVRQAFTDLALGPEARLVIKSMPWPKPAMNMTYRTPSGSRITELSAWLTEAEMRDLYAEADVFVWPTCGEGFGMPPLEAAATGLACILPNWSALEAYHDPSWCIDLPCTVGQIWEKEPYCGALIHYDDLKKAMRWAFEHQPEVRSMGQVAADTVHANWTWAVATRPGLARVLQHYKEASA